MNEEFDVVTYLADYHGVQEHIVEDFMVDKEPPETQLELSALTDEFADYLDTHYP